MKIIDAFKAGLRDAKPRRIKTTTYTLPAHWACALINGDESGMSEEESAALDRWIKDTRPGYCLGCSDEPEFCTNHDADEYALAGDCLTFTFEEINA